MMIQKFPNHSPIFSSPSGMRPQGAPQTGQPATDQLILSAPQPQPEPQPEKVTVRPTPVPVPAQVPSQAQAPAPSLASRAPLTLQMEEVPGQPDPGEDPRSGLSCGTFLRPDPFFADRSQMVIHANRSGNNPGGLEEIPYGKFKVIRTRDLLAGNQEVLIGFGQPKVSTLVPKADGSGYQKLNAAPFFRRDARITSGTTMQSGVFIRPKNLPPAATEALRKAMTEMTHHHSLSSARANAKVLSQAGFTSGGKKLSGQFLPLRLFKRLVDKGLEFQGQPVKFDIVSTTPDSLDQHFRKVAKGELCSPFHPGTDDTPANPIEPGKPVQPLQQGEDPNAPRIRIRNSRVGLLGSALRNLMGAHIMWEAVPNKARVDIDKFLPDTLQDKFSSGAKLTRKEKLKGLLFTPAKVKFIRKNMARAFDEAGEFTPRQIGSMLRIPGQGEAVAADKDGLIKYNIVITGDKSERGSRLVVARLKVEDKDSKADDILSKHVLISGYDKDVRFAGEMWAERYTKADGQESVRIHVSNNSGTYRPSGAQAVAAAEYMRALFPGVEVVAEQVDPTPKPKAKPDYLRNFAVSPEKAGEIREGLKGKVVTLHDSQGEGHRFKIRPFKTVELDTEFFDTAQREVLEGGGMLRTRTRFKKTGGSEVKEIDVEAKIPAKGSDFLDRAKGASFENTADWKAQQTEIMTGKGDNAVALAHQLTAPDAVFEPVACKDSMRELFFVSPTTPLIGRLNPGFLVMIDSNQTRPAEEPRPGQPGAQPHEEYHVVTPEIFTKLPWGKKITPDRIAEMEDLSRQLSQEFHLTESTQSAYQEAMDHLK